MGVGFPHPLQAIYLRFRPLACENAQSDPDGLRGAVGRGRARRALPKGSLRARSGRWASPRAVGAGAVLSQCLRPAVNAFARRSRRLVSGRVRFHDPRYTFASLCAAAGAPVERVSGWMGHPTIVTTSQTYPHVCRGEDDYTAEALRKGFPSIRGERWVETTTGNTASRAGRTPPAASTPPLALVIRHPVRPRESEPPAGLAPKT